MVQRAAERHMRTSWGIKVIYEPMIEEGNKMGAAQGKMRPLRVLPAC